MKIRIGTVQSKDGEKDRYNSRMERRMGTDQGIEEKDMYKSRILRIGTDQG